MNGPSIIDADVPVDAPYPEALHPYLSDHWIEHFTQSLDGGASPPAPPAPGAPRLTRNTWHAPPYYPPNSPIADRAGAGVRVAFLESGFTWLPAHMWRMDKEWKNLRRLVPWVRRPPSDYVREHVRLGIQPLDAPPTAAQMLQIIDQLGSDDLLMYTATIRTCTCSNAGEQLLDLLPRSMQNKVRSETARRLYRLDGSDSAAVADGSHGPGAQEHG